MPKKKQEERPEKPQLIDQYRAIGPAAIAAALLHATAKTKSLQKFTAPHHI